MHWKKIAHFVMLLCVTLSLSISGSVSAALQDPDTGGGQGAKYATKIEKPRPPRSPPRRLYGMARIRATSAIPTTRTVRCQR